ncbi:MAG: DUF2156 domain-containing protein [Myxococcota bacterium]
MTEGDRARVLRLLKQHGWNATSFQTLEPGFSYWFDAERAAVAYVDTGRAWVAAGAPIAAEPELLAVAQRFLEAARASGRRACFFAVEERFRPDFLRRTPIGEQPSWEPSAWSEVLAQSKSLREQLRRAKNKGVTVRSLSPEELREDLRSSELSPVVERWLSSRPMAPMGFLVQLHLSTFAEERRCFVAERGGEVVGLLHAVPVYARRGWFFEDLLRDPKAPNGTVEALIDAAMQRALAEGAEYVTLGLVPLAGELPRILSVVRQLGRGLYDFEGLRTFRARLYPKAWNPVFLSWPAEQSAVSSFADALTAFARGSFLRFGLATVMRGPRFLITAMALLLVPWTALIACVDGERWFHSTLLQWAWVAFDVVLLFLLHQLSRSWRRWLIRLLAGLITADAGLTLFQALRWPPMVPPAWGLVVSAVAVFGPAFSALLLWRAHAHRG